MAQGKQVKCYECGQRYLAEATFAIVHKEREEAFHLCANCLQYGIQAIMVAVFDNEPEISIKLGERR